MNKLLIANRGEIARRVIRSAHDVGIATVAVFGAADRNAPHTWEADEAVFLGDEADGNPYLDGANIIAVAKARGADAIHPGYGFLAENAGFAQQVLDAGLTWVGPSPVAMAAMAAKDAAKERARAADVPVIEGFSCADMSADEAAQKANELGYPVLLKAVAGGGGRGMRVVESSAAFADAMEVARAEANKSFGDDRLLVERYIARGRHVEVQVFGDTHGNVVHLFERECSIQRRHQKIVEESPSPGITTELRTAICDAAVALTAAIEYVGAGTVEFLVDDERGDFAFLEVNARIQVEHPVTELLTGVDLVAWQLHVADGGALPLTQDEITATGHAIEVRLCAEDPAADHRPQGGPVWLWKPGSCARIDSAFAIGGVDARNEVSVHYDSMVAKVIAHGPTRLAAIARLRRALADTALLGITSNRTFLGRLLNHPALLAGDTTTRFLSDHAIDVSDPRFDDATAIAAALWLHGPGLGNRFRSNDYRPDVTVLWHGEARVHVGLANRGSGRFSAFVDRDPDPSLLRFPTTDRSALLVEHADNAVTIEVNAHRRRFHAVRSGDDLWIQPHLGDAVALRIGTLLPEPEIEQVAGGSVVTESAAVVTEVHVAVGDVVQADAPLVTVEAMKMLSVLRAPEPGTVTEIFAAPGDSVPAGAVLVAIESDDETGDEA